MRQIQLSSRGIRYAGLFSLVAIIVLMSVIWIYHSSQIEDELTRIETEYRSWLQRVDKLLEEFVEIRGLLTTFVNEEQTDLNPLLNKSLDLIRQAETLLSDLPKQEHKDLIKEFSERMREYRTGMVAYSQELLLRRTGEGVRSWEVTLFGIEKEAYASITELKRGIREAVSRNLAFIQERGRTAKKLSLTLGVLGILAGISVVVLLNKALARSIQEMVNLTRTVADGDLRLRINGGTDNEIGALARNFSSMVNNLQELVKGIKFASLNVHRSAGRLDHYTSGVSHAVTVQGEEIAKVTSSVEKMNTIVRDVNSRVSSLTDSLEESSSSSHEMTASIKEVSQLSENMTDQVESITSSLTQINSNIKQTVQLLNTLSDSAVQISEIAEKMTSSSTDVGLRAQESKDLAEDVTSMAKNRGVSVLDEMIQITRKNKDRVDEYSRLIHNLGKKSSSVGKILDVIREVADQTNLLSINAAIIASKAGEHGRGFAVVADEIRQLSSATTENVVKIEQVIQGLQHELNDAVQLIDEVTEGVNSSISSAAGASEALNEIIEISSKSAQMASEIADLASHQTSRSREVLQEINKNTEQVYKAKSAVSEQKDGSDFILRAVLQLKDIADKLKHGTLEQAQSSNIISMTLTDTHAFSTEIRKAMELEHEASVDIGDALNRISHVIEKNQRSIADLGVMVDEMKGVSDSLASEVARFKVAVETGE